MKQPIPILFAILPIWMTFFSLSCLAQESTPKKPNVLFILADDLGYHDLSIAGSDYYHTPHLDSLARVSYRFEQGYACAQVCSPSRASIMTGNYTPTHGITDWIGAATGEAWRSPNHEDKLLPPAYNYHLKKEWTTLPEAFKQAGYTTFFAGKWHLGDEGQGPLEHGFDINKGGWSSGSPKGGYFSPWENPVLENNTPGENLSLRLARETNAFIDAQSDKPFFAYLSFYAVHGPIQTTQQRWKHYRDEAVAQGIAKEGYEMERVLPIRIVQDNPVYGGLVETMDDAVGLVLQKLREKGLDKNTIIVFTSDNGGVASGDAFSTSNLPLRGGKGYQWEGGIREPYFIKMPGAGAGSIDFPVSGADFYPTLLSLAQIEAEKDQAFDGMDISPLLKGETLAERPIFWHYPHYGNQGGNPASMVRLGRYKLIHYWEDGRNELYNLLRDPSEQHDISARLPEKAKQLEELLMGFLDKRQAARPAPDNQFDPQKREKLMQQRREVLLPELEAQRLKFLEKDYQPNEDWWGSALKVTND